MDISPDKQNIDRVFSNTTYYIDFYQRDYKWTEPPVKRLLDDIFYQFNNNYEEFKSLDANKENVMSKYNWYYLNTYVTNIVDGKVYVVDGQQRLTTLTIILIVLLHKSKEFGCTEPFTRWIESKVAGYSGGDYSFWMRHEKALNVFEGLTKGVEDLKSIDTSSGVTSKNIVDNYIIINNYIKQQITSKHSFETFTYYFLYRLVLINLTVEQTEVPMVFEVINDRGVKLKPYEILKGKLLGQVDKDELNQLKINDIWENQIKKINSYHDDEIDDFFTFYLKAKFSKTRAEANRFDNDYHRTLFSEFVKEHLDLDHNTANVKNFLLNDFKYYTNLYEKLLKYSFENDEHREIFYNALLDRNTQYMLIISACKLNDSDEKRKIDSIAYELDRIYNLLLLQQGYDSNLFATNVYKLNAEIKDMPVESHREIFDKYLLEMLSASRGSTITNTLSYSYFKDAGISLDIRFKRYFFARIERFIADNTNLELKRNMYDLIRNTGSKNGFHIEHIVSDNDENYELFDNDDEVFHRERNRLGGLLLLKGRDNQSSNNEKYEQKLKSYSNTLYWNETLREDTYKSKLDFKDMMKKHSLDFRHMDKFGPEELEERHKLLYKITKIIWK
ncbi:DUF262 domain-containing protein [Zobellia russellii]|uniref:DUF262 domain-containing protein n=1 Tax=Zobellia russellii TaxID=248907 RepID=UPI001BFF83BB|nr:DUF262 domain-containing protein [Zobellia russellii]MBT9190413.1 DUF262 domain-containing protein [Zobellia russellii]